jgi:hypothetical protein
VAFYMPLIHAMNTDEYIKQEEEHLRYSVFISLNDVSRTVRQTIHFLVKLLPCLAACHYSSFVASTFANKALTEIVDKRKLSS